MTDTQKGILQEAVSRKATRDGTTTEAVFADLLGASHSDRASALGAFVDELKAEYQAQKDAADAASQRAAAALSDCDAVLTAV